jgi:hypothetical protein
VRKLTSHQLRDIALITGGVALFVYILLRVINVSISVDEQGSYFMFVESAQFLPETYDLWSANNHMLNTFLMWICNNVFGSDQISLRLPNLLAGGLYIFSTAMMARKIPSPFAGVVAFVLMNTNPFMIEYFGLARGYGLANGFMALAFWQVWVYCDSGFHWKNLAIAMAACVLSVFANYNYLNLFLPLAGCVFLVALWQPGLRDATFRLRASHAITPFLAVACTLAVVIPISLQISAAGGFWENHFKTFWSDSIASVVLCSLVNLTTDEDVIQSIVMAIQIITALTCARIIWWTIQRWKKNEFQIFPLLIVATLSLAVLSVMMQYWMFDTPLPIHRICLIFVWPWLIVVAIAGSLSGKFRRVAIWLLVLVTLAQVGLFFRTISLEDMAIRPNSVQVDDAIDYLKNKVSSGETIMLGYDDELWSSGFGYYRQTMPMKEFDLVRDSLTTHPLNQYCLITPLYRGRTPGNNWIPEQHYMNGTVLYKNNALPSKPLSTHGLELRCDTITGGLDHMIVYNFGGCINDSVISSIGNLLRFNYGFRTQAETTGFIEIVVFRGEKTIHSTRFYIYPDSETRIAGENKIIVPTLQRGDCIVATLLTFPVLPQDVKQFSITVEGY